MKIVVAVLVVAVALFIAWRIIFNSPTAVPSIPTTPEAPVPVAESASLNLKDYVGRQMTLAVAADQGHMQKPEISMVVGTLKANGVGFDVVFPTQAPFHIPTEWLARVKVMDAEIRPLLGGSDLLLSVPRAEFEKSGLTLANPIGSTDYTVGKSPERD